MTDKAPEPEPFITLSSRVVWSCPWYSVRQDQIRLPNGQVTEYNVVQHGGAVWVVPVTTEGKMVLLRHYRYTVHDWCLEVPAGGIGEGERPEDVARRELREETGGRAQAWHYVGQFYTGNGTSDEVGHVFLATGVMLREPEHEPAEVIEICPTHLQEALRMAHANEISDGPSALAIMLSEPFLQELVGKIEVSRAEKL